MKKFVLAVSLLGMPLTAPATPTKLIQSLKTGVLSTSLLVVPIAGIVTANHLWGWQGAGAAVALTIVGWSTFYAYTESTDETRVINKRTMARRLNKKLTSLGFNASERNQVIDAVEDLMDN